MRPRSKRGNLLVQTPPLLAEIVAAEVTRLYLIPTPNGQPFAP